MYIYYRLGTNIYEFILYLSMVGSNGLYALAWIFAIVITVAADKQIAE